MDMIHFDSYSVVRNGLEIHVDFSKLDPAFKKAQFALDSAVMNSMLPYMPLQTGNLRQRTAAESASLAGTGVVVAAVPPYGRYQYMGKVMVDSVTGQGAFYIPTVGFRFHRGAVLKATERPLTYSQPGATPMWFETAKSTHLQDWIRVVKDAIGGELNGR